ncbi:MAG: aspartate aminotransferase family protein [Saprospiraceae bacterium]|jgi:sphinganine-1-phosphate aldolase|nr:aspartate aminotransferase family protein [Saprospiraceae bacterium]MDG1435835.1 aspartate aminotransferase family protein [Saprospiraceae bacterium]MDG2418398.1 aspartate aminotransferase family protein [Saprospiraceae bacterium]
MKKIPPKGLSETELFAEMNALRKDDLNWRDGRNFAYVYYPGEEILNVVKKAYQLFFSENALNPSAFPSLRNMENDVVSMSAHLFGGNNETVGSLTTGGTESILMTVKTAREWGKKNKKLTANPEIIIPATAHPAFFKAAHYFNLSIVLCPTEKDFRVDAQKMENLISKNTVLLVASAPSYPQGVVDPIQAIGQIAEKHDLLFHVDACIGGFMLPFLKQLDYKIPAFDFSVKGVTSISADIHKYGYAAKGASVILYKNSALRKHQFYTYTAWTGGIYASPTMTGTRPGGSIAAAYAALKFVGYDGYLKLAKSCMNTTQKLQNAIREIPEIDILTTPEATLFAITSNSLDIYEVGDEMGILGWQIDRQQMPPSLHFSINPAHEKVIDQTIEDLKIAVQKAKKLSLNKLGKNVQLQAIKTMQRMLPKPLFEKIKKLASKHSDVGGKRSAAMYGMIGELQGKGDLDDMIKDFLDKMMK